MFAAQVLLVFEVLWVVFYMGVSIASYILSTSAAVELMRDVLARMRSHYVVSVSVAVLVTLETRQRRVWYPVYFAIVYFVFLVYIDVTYILELLEINFMDMHLWRAAMALAAYQLLLSVCAAVLYATVMVFAAAAKNKNFVPR